MTMDSPTVPTTASWRKESLPKSDDCTISSRPHITKCNNNLTLIRADWVNNTIWEDCLTRHIIRPQRLSMKNFQSTRPEHYDSTRCFQFSGIASWVTPNINPKLNEWYVPLVGWFSLNLNVDFRAVEYKSGIILTGTERERQCIVGMGGGGTSHYISSLLLGCVASWWKVAAITECILFHQNVVGKRNHDQSGKDLWLMRQVIPWVLLCSSVKWWFHRLFIRCPPVSWFYHGPKFITFLFFFFFLRHSYTFHDTSLPVCFPLRLFTRSPS